MTITYKPGCTFDEETHTYTFLGRRVPSVTELCAPLTAGKYSVGAGVVEAAANRGSAVHEYTRLYDLDILPAEIEGEVLPYLSAYAAFIRDYAPQWDYVEIPLFSSSYAGTADRIGRIDGAPYIVDIKTTASMDRASKLALACQLYGYSLLARDIFFPDTYSAFRLIGVQLKKDGTYTVHEVNDITSRYKVKLPALFNSLVTINKALKGDVKNG